jgi:hypothetical protein
VTVTKVAIFPDDWNRLNEAERNEYTASAAAHGIALTLSPSKTVNPDHLIAARSEADDSPFAAPFYLGPVQCARAHWEHNLRELLDMTIPAFRIPSATTQGRSDPSSVRRLPPYAG